MPRFEPHGEAELEVRGPILVFHPRGPANREEIERLLAKVGEVASSVQGRRWGVLIIAEDDHLLTPDAEDLLRATAPTLDRRGQVATAIVARGGATGSILEAQFRRIHQATGTRVERFEQDSDATQWLDGHLRAG